MTSSRGRAYILSSTFSQPLLASIVKVVLVGGVMAGGAGGFYLVAENRSSSGGRDLLVAATSTAGAGTLTPVASTTAASPSAATAVPTKPPGTTTPQPPLTDTGYKAPDGSPLYKECIGPDPLALANGTPLANAPTLPLPPQYPTPGPVNTPPAPPANPNPEPRPPDADLPPFDVLAVTPADASTWSSSGTACVGGLSFKVPPTWSATTPYQTGWYATQSGATYASPDGSVRVDARYSYYRYDAMTGFRNASGGNGSYFLALNVPVTVGGAPGLVHVSSDIVELPRRYVTVAYLTNPRPDWYLSYVAFFFQPYSRASVADFLAMVASTRLGP